MHFNFPQSGRCVGGIEEDGEDGIDGAVGDVDPGRFAVAEPLGDFVDAPPELVLSEGITIEGDGNSRVRDGSEPPGGADVGLLQEATIRSAITPDTAATTFNRRPLTTPKRYGPALTPTPTTPAGSCRRRRKVGLAGRLGHRRPTVLRDHSPANTICWGWFAR